MTVPWAGEYDFGAISQAPHAQLALPMIREATTRRRGSECIDVFLDKVLDSTERSF
jgi:hypothetical protein